MASRPRRFVQEFQQWSKGAVVADSTADKVPLDAATRAKNTAFLKGGFPAKRKGVSRLTASSQSGKNPILKLGNALSVNWLIDSAGRWSKYSGGAFSAIDAGNPTPFTAGVKTYSVAAAKNLLFAVNGTDAKKTDGTTVSAFGIATPSNPVTAVGAAGNPTGTYTIALTSYNENTGHESSLGSGSAITVAGTKIHTTWSFPADPQVTKVRVHIFKQGLTNQFYRLGSTNVAPAPDPTTGGYSSGTTAIDINVTDADINNLIVRSPTFNASNNPPPTGLKYIAFHNGRMFGTDGTYLYYSQLDDPESWDPQRYEVVNTKDGQQIKAFISLADYQMLILKENSSYILVGPNDPNQWDIQPLDPTIGISGVNTLAATEGNVWWEAQQGWMRLQYSNSGSVGRPIRVDAPNISDRLESVNENLLSGAVSAYDTIHQRLFLGVPDANSAARNTEILPFNTKLGVFEDLWDPMDVSAMGVFVEQNVPYVVIGGYQGRLFKVWDTPYVDGVRITDGVSVTFTLEGTVGSATATTLTDPGATFDTAGDGLIEIPVMAVSPTGVTSRNIINSNTSTVLTLKDNWPVQPDNTWKYYIGNPWFEFDTAHVSPTPIPGEPGSSFRQHTFKQLGIRAVSETTANLDVYTIIDQDYTVFPTHNLFQASSGGARFDLDMWDVGRFGSGAVATDNQTLGTRGRTCGIRVQSRHPGESVLLLSLALLGSELGYNK